ncbi:galactose-binding domain-containing protein [Actinacidiphila alni]|uniref:galactose-binding domain-containing protein n=1 Tax=Actinacidiphila alni TaxID=380248 RepID=UPI003456A035
MKRIPSGLSRRGFLGSAAGAGAAAALGAAPHALAADRAPAATDVPWLPSYLDGRPVATLRLDARDTGPVLRHGDGPGRCDVYGARDIWVYRDRGTLYMNYDGAGDDGWLACLATSRDGSTWAKKGPVLQLGAPGSEDSGSASYGVTYEAAPGDWHMFYLGTPNTSPPPDRIPAFPYLTLKAHGRGPSGPWTKQPDVVPFRPVPGTYCSTTASPGQIVRHRGEYLQFFSASTQNAAGTQRTIGIARTKDLGGSWRIDPEPIVPLDEQIENTSLYYEPANDTWFLFTDHIALDSFGEYTDAVWVYWTRDLEHWDPQDKAVVLDRTNCAWSPYVMGLPSVVPVGRRLAVFYDGRPAPDVSHMGRDVGLAWLDLPLRPPRGPAGPNLARGARVTASSTYPGYAPERAADGRTSTQLGGDYSWTNAEGGALPQWLELELRGPRTAGRVDLYTTSGYELRDYRVQRWDGRAWADLAVVTGNTSAYRVHTFAPVHCERVRVLTGSGPDRQPGYGRINEVQIFPPGH